MITKKEYIAPEINSILISTTEELASGACNPDGSKPPEICCAVAPTGVGDPMSS